MNASVSKHPAALTDDGLSLFCDQFGLMVSAGIGFEEAASLLAEDSHAPAEQALFSFWPRDSLCPRRSPRPAASRST